jgi:hypothetical protein
VSPIAPILEPVADIFAAVTAVFQPIPYVFPAIADVFQPVPKSAVMLRIAPIFEPIAPVFTTIDHVLPAIPAILPAVANVFHPVADHGAPVGGRLRQERRGANHGENSGYSQRIQGGSWCTHNDHPPDCSFLVPGLARLSGRRVAIAGVNWCTPSQRLVYAAALLPHPPLRGGPAAGNVAGP